MISNGIILFFFIIFKLSYFYILYMGKKENPILYVEHLPKDPDIGQQYAVQTKSGIRVFKAEKKEGFGKFKIIKDPNKK